MLPKDWLQTTIIPIYKRSGARHDKENYRPVSITSVACKLMEAIIKDSIMPYESSNRLISPYQHNFLF